MVRLTFNGESESFYILKNEPIETYDDNEPSQELIDAFELDDFSFVQKYLMKKNQYRKVGSLLLAILSTENCSTTSDFEGYYKSAGLSEIFKHFKDNFTGLENDFYFYRREFRTILDYLNLCDTDSRYFTPEYFNIFCEIPFNVVSGGFYRIGNVHPIISNNIGTFDTESDLLNCSFKEKLDYYKRLVDKMGFSEEYIYTCDSINNIMISSLQHLLHLGLSIKRCRNCGNWFIPYTRSDTLYCDRIDPDNNKTCKEIGALKAYKDNLANDEAAGLYRKIYMAKMMQKRRNPDRRKFTKSFEDFKLAAKQWKSEIKKGTKTNQQYIEWLNSEREPD